MGTILLNLWLGLWLWMPLGHHQRGDLSVTTLRHLYAQAAFDAAAAGRFQKLLHSYSGSDATVLGYRAVAEAVQARYLWNPLAKLKAVRAAQAQFTKAVALAPDNVEIRFLRYTVESNVPHYLGFSQHLEDDRRLVMAGARHYPTLGLDAQSLQMIRDFMLTHSSCTPEEARMLHAIKP